MRNRSRILYSLLFAGVLLTVAFKQNDAPGKFNFHEYWKHANSAEFELEVNKDYRKALLEFKWMEKNGNDYLPAASDFTSEAICYAHLMDTAKAIVCLRKAVMAGYIDILDMAWVRTEIGDKPFRVIENELPGLIKKYYCLNSDKIQGMIEAQKIMAVDQFVRSQHLMKLLPRNDLDTLVHYADSINVNKYINDVKAGTSPASSWMIYHLYGSNDKYVPFVDSCLKSVLFVGKYLPEAYAQWIDRQRAYVEKRPQLYGSFTTYASNDFSKPVIMGTIQSVDSIDYYRDQIGLPPLWQDAQRLKFDLPKGYKK